jgi:hypothetical protein
MVNIGYLGAGYVYFEGHSWRDAAELLCHWSLTTAIVGLTIENSHPESP